MLKCCFADLYKQPMFFVFLTQIIRRQSAISFLQQAVIVWFNNTFNTCPTGSKHERGILAWNKAHEDDSSNTLESGEVYNLPFGISSYLSSSSWLLYIPFCPPGVPSSLDRCGADTNALGPKQPLGQLGPSQTIIGVAL